MTDLFKDDDLFAVRPAPPVAPKPARRPPPARATPIGEPQGPTYPVASYACPCGARDEVKEPAPRRLDCWSCHRPETMARWLPLHPPPLTAGRKLTAHELEGMRLDEVRSAKQARERLADA
jgi:hypothetical protein